MNQTTISFECITPCFCAGADQTQPEIRVSAIRGALRWWFRALGGTKKLETETFGGAEPITASAVQLRVAHIDPKPVGHLHQPSGVDPLSYILYFPSVSSDKRRWNPNSCFGTGTTFQLRIRQLRKLSPEAEQRLGQALLAFRHYGSIGMHITRGLGAVQATDVNEDSWKQANTLLEGVGFTLCQSSRPHETWDAALKEAGQWLQNDLRKEFGAGGNTQPPRATALGSAQPVRQTSAVYLRPVKKEEHLFFTAFEAPHDRVLGRESKAAHSQPILQSRDFSKPPPQGSQQGGGGHGRRR